ncbi:MAG: hypothetical protein H7328_06645 [Bdellovibrio sp.]|nr:hypothetical protein [Bdellovibrio sp.]
MKLILAFLFLSSLAQAFPEMIRHHYVNCSACHVSNNGGGVLNAYGRTISYEVLSTWGNDQEARAFYAIDPEKVGAWLNIGGDVRGLQVHQENPMIKRGKYFWMQGSVDVSATAADVTAFVTIGQVQTTTQTWREISPKFFLSYQATDELAVRAGRFIPSYGLNIPQHQYMVKDNLRLVPWTERDAADIQWNGERYTFVAGYSKSLLNSLIRDEEKAVNLQAQMTFADSHKVGINYWDGIANNYAKTMVGLQGVFGFTEKFYSLAEVDHVSTIVKASNRETKSIYELLKVGYEFYKGAHFQVVQEFSRPDLDVNSIETQSLGAGGMWYPRPHFELEGLWSKRRTLGTSTDFEDYAYLLTHFYF